MSTQPNILHILPFKSDGWHSIHHYSNLIKHGLGNNHFSIRQYMPNETLKLTGNFFARRVLLPFMTHNLNSDIIHICDASYSNLALTLQNKKIIITCHDLEFWKNRNLLNTPIRKLLVAGLSQAFRIITPSKTIHDELITIAAEKNITLPQIETIYNCVPESYFLSKKPSQTSYELRLLHVGNTHWPRKNFNFLLSVLGQLRNLYTNFKLTQIGPDFSKQHKKIIKQLNLDKNIIQKSNLTTDEMIEQYSSADLVLIPSQYEGFGFPVVEASACRTPFFASTISAFKEITNNSINLIPFEPNQWVKNILEFKKNKIFRDELESAGKEIANRFKSTLFLNEYKRIYDEVLKN